MHLRQKWTHSWKLESQKLVCYNIQAYRIQVYVYVVMWSMWCSYQLIVEDVTASDSGLLVCKVSTCKRFTGIQAIWLFVDVLTNPVCKKPDTAKSTEYH